MQSGKLFIRNTLWYFVPFLIMTIIAIISQNYTFRMMWSQNYEIIQNQLSRDLEDIEADIYSGRRIALEMSMDSSLSKENMEELGILTQKAIDRIEEYRIRLDICSSLFMTYSAEKIIDSNGITRLDVYCERSQMFNEDSTEVFKNLMATRENASCVLENVSGSKSVLFLYYFPRDTYDEERWIGFFIGKSKIEKRLQSILGNMDAHLILTYGDRDFVEVDQLSKTLSEEELSHIYDAQESEGSRISGYAVMLHRGNVYDMKMYVLLNSAVFTKTVRQEQIKTLMISIAAFVVLTIFLWNYGRYRYKKSQAVQRLAVGMYPEMDRKGIRGEYELIQKVLERDFERLRDHDQMLGYFRKESKRQLAWLLLKSTPPEELQIEELMENCGVSSDGSYYAVLNLLLTRAEGDFEFLEATDKVLMCHLDKSEFGMLLMVIVALQSRDENHKERLALAEKLLMELENEGSVCKAITGGLVYEQIIEIHSSQEEAFSLLSELELDKKSKQTGILFFDEIAQMSKRVPHITAEILQQFKEALLEESQEDARAALNALLAPPKEIAEELLTYVRYKIIQIMLDIWQDRGITQDSVNSLLHLIMVEDDDFKIEVGKCIEQMIAGTVNKEIDVQAVLDYTTEHALDSEISINSIADYFDISERTVRRIMKYNLNKTCKEYISELRLQRACELLDEGCLSIQAIAQQVGYYNVTSFNRLFKQMYGISPREYRTREK